MPLDSHFHKDGIDSLEVLLKIDHADVFVLVFEEHVFAIDAKIDVINFVLQIAHDVDRLPFLHLVDVYLESGLLVPSLYAHSEYLTAPRKTKFDDLEVLGLVLLFVS